MQSNYQKVFNRHYQIKKSSKGNRMQWEQWDYKPVTAEEELKLIYKAKDGCESSMNRLFEAHRPWWIRQSSDYLKHKHQNGDARNDRRQNYEMDDLLSICFIQMRNAVLRFDPDRGNRLLTYCGASIWKWFYMHERNEFRPMIMAEDEFLKTAAVMTDTTIETRRKIENEERQGLIKKVVSETLSGRDLEIINMRFFDDPILTLSQAGRELGITKERVRQIESKCKHLIRKAIEEKFPWMENEIMEVTT